MKTNTGSDFQEIKKFNIRVFLVYSAAVLFLVLKMTFHASGYVRLVSGLLPGGILILSYFCYKRLAVRYILSGIAFISTVVCIFASKFGAEDILFFIIAAPALYAYLLPDIFSPGIVGLMLAVLMLRDRSTNIPERMVVETAVAAASNGALLSAVSCLMRRFIKERDKYRMLSAELQDSNEKLKYGILHDSLTGLPNRNFITRELANAIKVKKQNSNYLFAIAFIDLDRFKSINDSLGHNYGDKLLIEVSKRLKSCLRSDDSVSRLGGDEFVIFLNNIRDSQDAERIIDRVLKELKKPFNLNGHELTTSASIGIVMSNNEYDMPGEYLRYADITMYRAKTLGKSRYEIYDPTASQNFIKNLKLENDLKYAIDKGEFKLLYQPIFSLNTQKILGFEALLRWNHPELGIISPKDFIPLAEETGLIVPIGKWVLHEACSQVGEWQRQIGPQCPLTINVNLSPVQLTQLGIAMDIGEIIRDTGVSPDNLHIEVTESALIKDVEISRYMLEQIKNLGVRVYIDDFGTGYSSLSYLNQFPFDAVKLDSSFVQQIKGSSGLLRNIIHMAHELNMSVIGEGIESLEQMERLNEFGCECGQGYYFSRPVESEAVEKMLQRHAPEEYPESISTSMVLLEK